MTRQEELAQYIKSELANEDPEIYLDIDDYEIIVKALEQEPCGDVISRQYLLDNCIVDKVTMPYVPVNKIKNAPPVNPVPCDNATNGDVIKAMFPNLEWIGSDKDVDFYYLDSDLPYAPKFSTFRSWWDAPYKTERKGNV